jgi:glycosyltransferase involved in cell wall biosynthesis
MSKRILVGVPPKHHVLLSFDEITGFTDLGHTCRSVLYGRNDFSLGKVNKLVGVVKRTINIVKELYSFSPDILYLNSRFDLHGTTRDFLTVLLIKLLYWRKLKIVIKTHGSDPLVLQRPGFFFRRIVIPYLLKQVDAWFFLSQEEKEIIRNYNPMLADKIFITANIVDPERSVTSMEFKKRYALDDSQFKVLFVGRMVREKGVFSLLKSIPQLECKDDCLFIFVGDGPDLRELKELSSTLGVTKQTRFLGYIPDEECDHFYANADMLAFPTFFNEGFPMALFKSVAAGLPVITTRIRAAKDHLSAPDNVLWVDGESPESVAEAISTLYRNHELRMVMSRNNKTIAKKFSRESVCSEMSEVILSI